MAFGAKVLLLEGESANESREGALSGLPQIAGGRGVPRSSALMRPSYQPASTRTEKRGDIQVPKGAYLLYPYRSIKWH